MSNINKMKQQLSEAKDPLQKAKDSLGIAQGKARHFEKLTGDLDIRMQQLLSEIEDLSSHWRQSDPKRKDDMTFQKIAKILEDADSAMSDLSDASFRVYSLLKKSKVK